MNTLRNVASCFFAFLLVSCAGDGSSNTTVTDTSSSTANSTLVSISDIDIGAGVCPNGGIKLDTGFDDNGDSELDVAEITQSFNVCNGLDGVEQLVTIEDASSTECLYSGKVITFGEDSDGNGTLEGGEIISQDTICAVYNRIVSTYRCDADLLVDGGSLNLLISYRLDQYLSGDLTVSAELLTPAFGLNKTNSWTPFITEQAGAFNTGYIRINFDLGASNGGYWILGIERLAGSSGVINNGGNISIKPYLKPDTTNFFIEYHDNDIANDNKVWRWVNMTNLPDPELDRPILIDDCTSAFDNDDVLTLDTSSS